ncbi:MAG: chorismate synthase [Lachnospiraceae bacterium]|nr:chorismate synthase [Lachnospiraceae bacterium]
MAGSTIGNSFRITTWGESHGKALGAVIDGCPAGLQLSEEDIQVFLNRRKPGQSKFTTARGEGDEVEILSGVFEGVTTGTPISVMVRNADQHSKDYSDIARVYRPGHADYTFMEKYGIRDYRGGGRSSGRETIGRVAGGAVASKILETLGITVCAYTKSIGEIGISHVNLEEMESNQLYMPDTEAATRAAAYLEECIKRQDSAGGVIECVISGMPVGIGEPVFDKLDANLAKAMLSIGAVKGFEIGDGFAAARANGSTNNDAFVGDGEAVYKATNHAGGVLGGMSDGSDVIFRVAIKPTPSISQPQQTVNEDGEQVEISIHGRHDPIIVPRAVVVVECMAAMTVLDLLYANQSARLEFLQDFYNKQE